MAAVQAVDAAAAALPPFNDDAILFMSDNAYAGRAPDEPPNHGSKVRCGAGSGEEPCLRGVAGGGALPQPCACSAPGWLVAVAAAGAQVAPVGHPDCLTGKTFVISGTLDSLMRGEAEDFIKRHGGKVGRGVGVEAGEEWVGWGGGTAVGA